MTLQLQDLLVSTGALLEGHFRLSSGLHSPAYVQCARLLEHPRDARAIGMELAAKLTGRGITRIVAPALGGLVIGYTVADALGVPMIFTERKDGAMSLRRGFGLTDGDQIVIVEDVVTTGKSTLETVTVLEESARSNQLDVEVVGFASILNRTGKDNPFGRPYAFLLAMNLATNDEASCPLCAEGIALDAPGSRFSAPR
ncbi:MAG TPA: orotate phosphoribosyltransferase [Thermoanaerobaculia bacterium]|nr:orotate phosphoribosyltransferase [Thermoanaerobaculia bacterium]